MYGIPLIHSECFRRLQSIEWKTRAWVGLGTEVPNYICNEEEEKIMLIPPDNELVRDLLHCVCGLKICFIVCGGSFMPLERLVPYRPHFIST